MKVTIHQPEHFPYMGFFEKMAMADLFVVLDDVQYKKNNWQNRNKFLNKNGVEEFFGVEDDAGIEVIQENKQEVNVEGPTINITIPEQKKDTVVKKVYIKPKPKLTETEKRKKEGIDW